MTRSKNGDGPNSFGVHLVKPNVQGPSSDNHDWTKIMDDEDESALWVDKHRWQDRTFEF